jgi:hypothetical protein
MRPDGQQRARALSVPRGAAAQNYAARRSESVCARSDARHMSLPFRRVFGQNDPGHRLSKKR